MKDEDARTLGVVHERIGEAYAYVRGACAALEHAVQDYAETLEFLRARVGKAENAAAEARGRAARADARRAACVRGVDDRRLREVLRLAKRAREACALVDARGKGDRASESDDDALAVAQELQREDDDDDDDDDDEQEEMVKVPEALRLPLDVSKKLRVYARTRTSREAASNSAREAEASFIAALRSRHAAANASEDDARILDRLHSWARKVAAVQALDTAKDALDAYDFRSGDQRETALLLAHVSRVLRTCKSTLVQSAPARHGGGDGDDDDDAAGWTWRDECLRVVASAGAQETEYGGSSRRRDDAYPQNEAVRGIADCWVPPQALALCEPLATTKARWAGTARVARGRGRDAIDDLEASVARNDVMATLLQLHIETAVVPPLLESMRPATLARARLASWFITGRQRHLRVLRRAAADEDS